MVMVVASVLVSLAVLVLVICRWLCSVSYNNGCVMVVVVIMGLFMRPILLFFSSTVVRIMVVCWWLFWLLAGGCDVGCLVVAVSVRMGWLLLLVIW